MIKGIFWGQGPEKSCKKSIHRKGEHRPFQRDRGRYFRVRVNHRWLLVDITTLNAWRFICSKRIYRLNTREKDKWKNGVRAAAQWFARVLQLAIKAPKTWWLFLTVSYTSFASCSLNTKDAWLFDSIREAQHSWSLIHPFLSAS